MESIRRGVKKRRFCCWSRGLDGGVGMVALMSPRCGSGGLGRRGRELHGLVVEDVRDMTLAGCQLLLHHAARTFGTGR